MPRWRSRPKGDVAMQLIKSSMPAVLRNQTLTNLLRTGAHRMSTPPRDELEQRKFLSEGLG